MATHFRIGRTTYSIHFTEDEKANVREYLLRVTDKDYRHWLSDRELAYVLFIGLHRKNNVNSVKQASRILSGEYEVEGGVRKLVERIAKAWGNCPPRVVRRSYDGKVFVSYMQANTADTMLDGLAVPVARGERRQRLNSLAEFRPMLSVSIKSGEITLDERATMLRSPGYTAVQQVELSQNREGNGEK